MTIIRRLAGSLWLCLGAVVTQAAMMTVYSDGGIVGDDVFTWSQGDNAPLFDGKYTALVPPEGQTSFRASASFSWAGWGVKHFAPKNYSAYAGGTLEFWIYTTQERVKIEIKNGATSLMVRYLFTLPGGWGPSKCNKWQHVKIALPANLASVDMPFAATTEDGGTYYVDLVRWTTDPITSVRSVSASVKNLSDNSAATQLTWGLAVPGGGWAASNQYVQLDIDPGADLNWGLQVYTDNRNVSSNPRYTGALGTNPAGLVNEARTDLVLPLCWRVTDTSTNSLTIVEGANGGLYSQELGGEASQFRCFQWMKDASTPNIPQQFIPAFLNGEDAVTVWDHEGIHYAQGERSLDPNYWGKFWGSAQSPVYVYFGVKCATALTPASYRTNRLILEYFTE